MVIDNKRPASHRLRQPVQRRSRCTDPGRRTPGTLLLVAIVITLRCSDRRSDLLGSSLLILTIFADARRHPCAPSVRMPGKHAVGFRSFEHYTLEVLAKLADFIVICDTPFDRDANLLNA